MKVIKAPESFHNAKNTIFLAGSIEMGKAEDWQKKVENLLADKDVTLLNPRRDDWDDSWVQSIHHNKFRQQVEWELKGLETADKVIVYYSPGTFSPISLLELGLVAKMGKAYVCCPEGFYRKGNVEIVCDSYGIPLFETIEELIDELKENHDQ